MSKIIFTKLRQKNSISILNEMYLFSISVWNKLSFIVEATILIISLPSSPFRLSVPAPPMNGHANTIVRAPAPQDGVPAPGHFPTLQNGQNSLSQNGIAALSHMAQHMTHTNGISALQNDKSGVPGV